MSIRPARAEDAPGLAAQMRTVVEEGRWLASETDRPLEQLTEMFRSSVESGNILFVLEDDERIVGAISIHPTGVRGVYSLGMSILAEYRGQGWGRRLVETALEAAQGKGIRKVELEVFPDNGRAIGLYASCGFEVEGIRRDHYPRLDGSVRSAVLMARFLGTSPE
jgi:ribosomal protein S18 acetylase RimI-like enzyme